MEVFLVTSGDYEDYSIDCVCSTIEKAELAKKFYEADSIERRAVDDPLPEHPKGMFWYNIVMYADGSVASSSVQSGCDGAKQGLDPRCFWEPTMDGATVTFMMWAIDEAEAEAIASDHQARLVASGEWTTDWATWYGRKLKKEAK